MKQFFIVVLVLITVNFLQAQNVGIGTTAPNAKAALEINSTTKGLLIPSMTTSQRLAITVSTAAPSGLMVYDTDRDEFYHYNGSSWSPILNGSYWTRPIASRKRISNNLDSVGIGTVSPTEWLDVDGNIRSRNNVKADNDITATGDVIAGNLVTPGNILVGGVSLFSGNVTANSDLIINNTTATLQLKSSNVDKGFVQLSGDDLRLGTNSSNTTGKFIVRTGGTNNLTVTSDGNTGVGTESPVAKLHIHSGSSNTALRLQADGAPSLQFYSGTTSIGSIQTTGTNLRMIAPGDYVNVNDVLYADAGSNRVGIGTNSPTEKLHVQGNAFVSGNINVNDAYVAGDLEINGQINGNVQLNDTLYGPTIFCNRVSAEGGAFGTSASTGSLGYLAVGYDVLTNAAGACIIADGTTAFMNNGTPNRMLMRFNQGYRLYTMGDLSVGVYMNQGDNSWSSTSDSTKKENFMNADGNAFLQKIAGMKLGSWNYKTQEKKLFRHYGPMAQEFYSNFGSDGIGKIGNDTTIATADIDGVMMIAIQALIKEKETLKNNYEKQALEINKLKENEKNLLQRLEKIEAMLSKNPAITTN